MTAATYAERFAAQVAAAPRYAVELDGVAHISTADKLQTLADLLALASKLAAEISSATDVAGLHYLTKVEAQNLARSARGYESARQNILRGDSL